MPVQRSSRSCSHQRCSPSVSWDLAPRHGRRLLARFFFLLFFCCLAEGPASPPRAPGSAAVGRALWKSGCCSRSTCALTLRDRNQLRGTAGSDCSGRWSLAAPRALHALAQEPCPSAALAQCLGLAGPSLLLSWPCRHSSLAGLGQGWWSWAVADGWLWATELPFVPLPFPP